MRSFPQGQASSVDSQMKDTEPRKRTLDEVSSAFCVYSKSRRIRRDTSGGARFFPCESLGLGVEGLGVGICLRFSFRIQGSGFRVQGAGFRVQDSGFRGRGGGFRVQGSGFKILLDSYVTVVSESHYQSTLDEVYVYVVPWSEFPIVPSYSHYPQGGGLDPCTAVSVDLVSEDGA